MVRLRAARGAEADVYFYRLLAWAMKYRQHGRVLPDDWSVLVEVVRWPEGEAELREAMVSTGLVDPLGRVFSWAIYNGWILEKYERDRKRHRAKVRAGEASARVRRAQRAPKRGRHK